MNRMTTALVLETNNLRGGASSADRVASSVERLLLHLAGQTLPLRCLDEIVITHDGLEVRHERLLQEAAGAAIRFVRLPPDTGYYEAKNLGFDATTAEIVAFGDADCWPDPAWLERLFAPFADDPDTRVVAGRTTYRDDVLGIAATSIDFMYFASPLGEAATRNFYANNVAFRRDVFAARRYMPAEGIYRGHCQRLRLRLLRGADTVEMTPHLADAFLPRRFRWLGRMGPLSPLGVLAVRLGFSARAVGHQDTSEVHGLRRAACLAAVAGISASDAMGALARSVGRADLGVHDGGFKRGALSYHGDGDRLAPAPVTGAV